MSSYGMSRPGNYYSSPRSYGTTPSYGSSYGSYSKPSYTPSSKYSSSSYIPPSRDKSVDRASTGYTSDYGKSGYTSDYGKSGYASDRNRVGYTSDYNAKPSASTNYSSYSKPSYGYGRSLSRQNSVTSSDRLSRQNSVTGSDRLSRQNSVTGTDSLSRQNSIQNLSRQNSVTGRDSLSRQNSVSGRDSLYRRDSYGVLNNLPNTSYGGYSRSQSREEEPSKVNGLSNSESKSRVNCKAPADFTTDESESEEEEDEEEEETESDSEDLEDDETIMVTRATSPTKESTNGTSAGTNKIATTSKEKIKINFNKPRNTSEFSCQVAPDDFPPKRERFISSRPTSLYLNSYYPSSSSNRFSSSTPSTRTYGSTTTSPKTPEKTYGSSTTISPKTPEKTYGTTRTTTSPIKTLEKPPSSGSSVSKIPVAKQQLAVDEPVSAGGFSRDASPNARQTEEPNKDFRKSVLNMNVDDKLKDEYGRRQEEMRRHRRRHGREGHGGDQKSSSGSPSSSSEDENHLQDPDHKRKVLKKSPSRSGVLSKCGSKSKMEAGVKKSNSHARVQRRVRDDGSEMKQKSSSGSTSSSSDSEEDSKRTRPRQRWRGTRSSNNDTEDNTNNNTTQQTIDDSTAPALIIHPPAEPTESEDQQRLKNILQGSNSGSSDLTSPGEVVHLAFPPPKTPPPLERVDSGRNVAVSVNVADLLKPKAATLKKSSGSSSESESSDEEDERDLLTPVVPVNDPADKSPEDKKEPSSSEEESEEAEKDKDEEDDEEEEDKVDEDGDDSLSTNVQRSATVIHVKEPEKEGSSEEESSEEESSEEESEDENEKLKRCPTQVIKPPSFEKKKESESEEEESEEEEDSSSENEKDDKKTEIDIQLPSKESSPQLEDTVSPPASGESYWPKVQKKDSLTAPDNLTLFIGKCEDIDEMLGVPSPVSPGSARAPNSASPTKQEQPFKFQSADVTPVAKKEASSSSTSSSEEESEEEESSSSSEEVEEVEASRVRFHESKPQKPELGAYTEEIDSSAVRIRENKALNSELAHEEIDSSSVKIREPTIMHGHITKAPIRKAEECEIVKRGNLSNGTYVDNGRRRSSSSSRRNSSSKQLVSKANALIEKLNTTGNRDLRRTLFSLKQVFQDEKDLVGAFIESGGLNCLIKVGAEGDQNYQNYIMRALGQVMLYVDGMNGIQQHAETLKWLYNLATSKYRMVSKMALKLLVMFAEYAPSNALLLKDAVITVDRQKGNRLWSNVMQHLKERDNLDMELLVFCVTLINKVADGFNEQDDYFDFVDALEEQGMEQVIQFHLCRAGTDKELLKQLQIYEAVLKHEDGEDDGKPYFGTFIERSKNIATPDRGGLKERRKSRRHSTPLLPSTFIPTPKTPPVPSPSIKPTSTPWVRRDSRENVKPVETPAVAATDNGIDIDDDTGITPALRRRRDARNRTLTGQNDPSYPVSQPQTIPSPEIKDKPAFHSDRATCPSLVSRQRSLFENQKEEEEPPPKEPLSSRRGSRGESSLVKLQIQAAEVKPAPPPSPTRPAFGRQNSLTASVPTTPPEAPPKRYFGQPNRSPVLYTSSETGTKAIPKPTWGQNNQKTVVPEEKKPTWGQSNQKVQEEPKPTWGQSNQKVPEEPKPTWGQSSYQKVQEEPKPTWGQSHQKVQEEPKPTWGQSNQKVPEEPKPKFQLKKDLSNKDLQNRYSSVPEKTTLPKAPSPSFGAIPGVVNRAKEGLAGYGTSRMQQKSPSGHDLRKSASGVKELHWDQLMQTMRRPLRINDLDFTDLLDEDDVSILMRPVTASAFPGGGPPPPPPPMFGGGPPPPPPPPGGPMFGGPPPPPPPPGGPMFGGPPPPPPPPGMGGPPPPPPGRGPVPPPWLRKNQAASPMEQLPSFNKKVKTVKLFWKEVKEEPMLVERSGKKRTIWDELKPVALDTQRIENLFENKAKDILNKKVQDGAKKTELIVLDTKRSNAINIGMTKLPPKGAIKAAILKMDTTIMNREGIEKILTTMMPTEEERNKIVQAQLENPDIPLGSAEQFLLTLASISELEARLKLWAFRLDYENMEKEVAEPLMDLKQAIDEIENSKTFRIILSILLSIGNFLNNSSAKGFSIEYLSKVPEVKDTVHKHSLLHHICTIVMEKFPDTTNLYSEFGAVTRASKADFDEIAKNLIKMETECKASWEYLKAVTKHDGIPINKSRLSEFLNDCAERIIVLGIIHRRVINRFVKLLVFLGFPSHVIRDAKVAATCRIVSEFSLEYRTCRERVQQQIEKAAALRERAKTKGKAAAAQENQKFRPQTKEQREDQQLRQILGESDAEEAKMTQWGSMVNLRSSRPKNTPGTPLSRPNSVMLLDRGGYTTPYESTTDIDDEILESLLKTAQPNRTEPRTRKKARYADRKSLRRTLKNGLDIGDGT